MTCQTARFRYSTRSLCILNYFIFFIGQYLILDICSLNLPVFHIEQLVLFNSNKLDTAPCEPCPQHPMKDSLTTWFADSTEWRASDGEWEVGDWKIIGYIHVDPALLGMQLARWVKRKQTRVSLLEIQHARFSKYGPRRKPNLHPSCLLNIRGRWTGSQTTHGHAVSACLCAITGLSDWVAQSFRRVPLSNEALVSVCDAGKAAAKQYRAFCQRRDRLSGPPL